MYRTYYSMLQMRYKESQRESRVRENRTHGLVGEVKRDARKRRAFTLIELLVVIAIISLLVMIMLPSLTTARTIACRTICMSNLHQLHSAIGMYQADYDGYFPYEPINLNWFRAMNSYDINEIVVNCPEAPTKDIYGVVTTHYAMNIFLLTVPIRDTELDSTKVLIMDVRPRTYGVTYGWLPPIIEGFRHIMKGNLSLTDGSVLNFDLDNFPKASEWEKE